MARTPGDQHDNEPAQSASAPDVVTAATTRHHLHAVPRLRIDDLVTDRGEHLDPHRVAHYAAAAEPVAPVVVYRTPEGLLVADGHHRIAATRQRGDTTIEAEIRDGCRHDALRYAGPARRPP